ncbi:hypothetical protein CSC81_18825, partial [Tenacibaculum discolor]
MVGGGVPQGLDGLGAPRGPQAFTAHIASHRPQHLDAANGQGPHQAHDHQRRCQHVQVEAPGRRPTDGGRDQGIPPLVVTRLLAPPGCPQRYQKALPLKSE